MSIYAVISLNTIITITENTDFDDDYELFKELNMKYVLNVIDKAKLYDLETEVSFADNNINLIIHNTLGKTTLVFSGEEVTDFPVIPDDESFTERCQAFIRDLAEIYPEASLFNLTEPKKRIFTSS